MKYHFQLKLNDIETTEKALFKMSLKRGANKFETRDEAEKARNYMLTQKMRSGKTVAEELARCFQTLDIEEIKPKKKKAVSSDSTFVNPFKVGDILTGDSGCTMTLPVFYEVVKVTKAQVVLRELKSYISSGTYFQGYTMPCLGEYAREATSRCGVKKFSWGETFVSVDRTFLHPWDGKEKWHDRLD